MPRTVPKYLISEIHKRCPNKFVLLDFYMPSLSRTIKWNVFVKLVIFQIEKHIWLADWKFYAFYKGEQFPFIGEKWFQHSLVYSVPARFKDIQPCASDKLKS